MKEVKKMKVISEWNVKKTRKEFECYTCGMIIPIGSPTRNQKISTDNGIITVRNCDFDCGKKKTNYNRIVYPILTGVIAFVAYMIWSGM